MIQNANIILTVADGAQGASATNWTSPAPAGATGTPASCSFWWDTCAGPGGIGAAGAAGRQGMAGGTGARGQLSDWEVDRFGPNVRIQARGGTGGRGGNGALGQTGGPGGTGGDGARCELPPAAR